MSAPNKPVEAVVERGPNYIFHLLAVAGVGFVSDYGERYRHTVVDEDRQQLETMRDLLSFQDDRGGVLVVPSIFIPAYLNLDTAQAFQEYFDRLAEGVAGRPEVFLDRYEGPLRRLGQDWVQVVDERWLAQGRGLAGESRRIGELMARNLSTYLDTVWVEERPGIAAVAEDLNRYFAERDVIGAWERFTGLAWKSDRYQIVLVSAIKNGPRANSLGYERNVFYTYEDFESMTRFISHETGTHILIDLIKAFSWPDPDYRVRLGPNGPVYDYGLVYRGYENLCRFFNGLVLGLDDDLYSMGPDYRSNEFQRSYQEIRERRPEATPLEMLTLAVEGLGGRLDQG